MDFLLKFLPIIIYFLLIALLIIGIILGIKLILVINKSEKVINNVEEKISAFDNLFGVLELTSNKLASVYGAIIDAITGVVNRLISKKKERNEEDE